MPCGGVAHASVEKRQGRYPSGDAEGVEDERLHREYFSTSQHGTARITLDSRSGVENHSGRL